jgi:hypothetical protein
MPFLIQGHHEALGHPKHASPEVVTKKIEFAIFA